MMTIRVIINGAAGRMGQVAVQAVSNDPELELVAGLGKGDDLFAEINKSKADVVVDLTNALVGFENVKTIIEAGAHPVVGTSGLTPEQITTLTTLAADKKLGGIIAPNFSIGAVLMMKYAQDAAKYLSHVEIIEYHHDQKVDAPSGTAIKTADMIAENLQVATIKEQHEIIPGSRGANQHNIPIHAIRLPGVIAIQQVVFGSVGETLMIESKSINRECFMPGILMACKKVGSLDGLVYGLESIL